LKLEYPRGAILRIDKEDPRNRFKETLRSGLQDLFLSFWWWHASLEMTGDDLLKLPVFS